MDECIKAVSQERRAGRQFGQAERFGLKQAEKVNAFHKSFPEYSVTPLARLKNLADILGTADIYVKDESFRFGMNAFKVLGGSYCLGRFIAQRLGKAIEEMSYENLVSSETRRSIENLIFVTATDGNHGRGIAWTANSLGVKSVVYMPKGSSAERLENIRELGAKAFITEMNYDDTVRFAADMAEKNDWILVQDTAWEGYETIPGWIMEGYTTMVYEAVKQLQGLKPTHVFLQAGVGAMSGAVTGFFVDVYKEACPIIVIVEPNKADCIYRTAEAADGKLHAVTGNIDTIMAGLACGEPCTIGWNILSQYADHFVSVPDYVAAKGMRILGNPIGDDPKVISGESGASTLGFIAEVMQNQSLDWLKHVLKLNCDSRILCISTEGDTDQVSYRNIVWDGKYPSASLC